MFISLFLFTFPEKTFELSFLEGGARVVHGMRSSQRRQGDELSELQDSSFLLSLKHCLDHEEPCRCRRRPQECWRKSSNRNQTSAKESIVFLKVDLESKRSDGAEMALMIIHELPVKNVGLSIRQTQVEVLRCVDELTANANIQLHKVIYVTLSQGGQS